MIRYGSICSGIEAASVAWEPLGWHPAFFAEIDAFPASVMAHHHGSCRPRFMPSPDEPGITEIQAKTRRAMIRAVRHLPEHTNGVPNYGDFTQIPAGAGPVDLIVGGTPCQSFSVAGKRLGLDDPRGNLALEHIRLAKRLGARWFLWENVPGVLSSSNGRDFADFLGFLSGRSVTPPRDGWKNAGIIPESGGGYGLAWRVLDAQYVRVDGYPFAVPQRRRRVFVVGYSGDWRRAAAVLFEPEGMQRNHPPRRKAGQGIAPTIGARPTGGGGLGTDAELDGALIVVDGDVSATVTSKWHKGTGEPSGSETQNLIAVSFAWQSAFADTGSEQISGTLVKNQSMGVGIDVVSLALRGREDGHNLEINDDGAAHAILTPSGGRGGMGVGAVAIQAGAMRENPDAGPDGVGMQHDLAYTIEARAEVQGVAFDQTTSPTGMVVRRLMPLECARLQGFADDHCMIPWRGKPADQCPDGPQYKAYGNSMAVNVMRWLGMRIDMMERLIREGRI